MYDYIISLREEVWTHKTSLTLPLFIKYLYQARKVSMFVVSIYLGYYGFTIRFLNCSHYECGIFLFFILLFEK